MIHARIKHKSGAEDERTALIFGPLLYLPANTLWQILRSSCFDNESMPQKGGELLHYEFWPNYNKTEHTSNESYVEPDLLLEFEYFNLLPTGNTKGSGKMRYRPSSTDKRTGKTSLSY